jgi:dihydroorotate dehydrogenase
MTESELEAAVDVAELNRVAGIIATNTTVSREGLRTPNDKVKSFGDGGLSGAPLRKRSDEMIARLYRLTNAKVPLIGVGGVFSAEDAWQKICAGASLVQLYTGFIYEGPGIARSINKGLQLIMKREGISSLDEAVGSSSRELISR